MSLRLALAALTLSSSMVWGSSVAIRAVPVAAMGGAAARSYTIDSSRSGATIQVGKAGAFSFAAGHPHEVVAPAIAGTITVDVEDPARSNVRATIDASSLRVSGKGEPVEDVPKVQETMLGPRVLDVQRFPTIEFVSTSVAIKNQTEATVDAIVEGQLTVHNVTRSTTVPVTVRMESDTLTATGRFAIKQSEYGIKPVSVGGVVSVKDTVNVTFTIVAR